MRKISLSNPETVRALLANTIQGSDEFRFLHRLHCVALAGAGCSCYQIARWFGNDPRSVERWVHAFKRNGAQGLRQSHAGGRPRRLDAVTGARLSADLARSPRSAGYEKARWNGPLVAHHVLARYGISLGIRQCQRLVKRASQSNTCGSS